MKKSSDFRDRQAFGTNAERQANRLDKAVILTDGYAGMKADSQKQLKEHAFRALTVLFGGRTDSPEFETLGDIVQLQDITC